MLMVHTYTSTRRRVITATILSALLALGGATAAGAHPHVARWWQFDKSTWHRTWRADPALFRAHMRWHRQHASAVEISHQREHHQLAEEHLRMHLHPVISSQTGEASWYRGDAGGGPCGKPLHGLYAASRTLPCGALVSVRANGRYVLVRILDRGPFGSSSRILDLSPKAFSWLAPLGAGVIDVRAVRLRR
ncbi:MAG: septal ring lytic transglycosylase RlpA family protein [Actinomycetota bacterium]